MWNRRFDNWKPLGTLLLLYVLLHGGIAALIPSFEPAIHNDDWVYVYTIERIADGESFRLHPMSAALALPQLLFAWGVHAVTGEFSYTLLRGLMVLFGFVPIWYCWKIFKRMEFHPRSAMIGSLLFMANPLLVSMTWSYQTDVVYIACLLGAFYHLIRACDEQEIDHESVAGCANWNHHLFAFLWLLAACTTRQSGIFVAGLIMAWCVLRGRWLWGLFYGSLIPITSLTENYFVRQSDLPYLPYVKKLVSESLWNVSAIKIVQCLYETGHVLALLALFAAPLILLSRLPKKSKAMLVLALLLFGGMWFLDRQSGRSILMGNYIYFGERSGLGPDTLAVATNPQALTSSTGMIAILLSYVGILAGILWCWQLFGEYMQDWRNPLSRLSSVNSLIRWSIVIQIGSVVLVSVMIGRAPLDRYLLSLIPFMLLTVIPIDITRRSFAVAGCFALMLATYSLCGVVDYWRWNAVRWQAVRELEQQGIDAWAIDGGYEYNGIHGTLAVPAEIEMSFDAPGKPSDPDYYQTHDTYSLRFEPAGSPRQTVAEYDYRSLCSLFQKKIYVTRQSKEQARQMAADESVN